MWHLVEPSKDLEALIYLTAQDNSVIKVFGKSDIVAEYEPVLTTTIYGKDYLIDEDKIYEELNP